MRYYAQGTFKWLALHWWLMQETSAHNIGCVSVVICLSVSGRLCVWVCATEQRVITYSIQSVLLKCHKSIKLIGICERCAHYNIQR